jgi:S-DNA-T family DNA segregation ATPase FtsK/SpoIIIE
LVNIKVAEEGESNEGPKQLENRDELYEDAITIVVREQRGSCSLLQRAMGIGYGRAARLIDFMAEDGYLGPYNGSKAREVLLNETQWSLIQAGDPNPVNDEDWPDDDGKSTLKKAKTQLQALENDTGLTSNLSANAALTPKPIPASKPKKILPPIDDDEDEYEDDEQYEDDYESEDEGENEEESADETDDVEAAADEYEAEDDDYDYEDDSEYEDVEDD